MAATTTSHSRWKPRGGIAACRSPWIVIFCLSGCIYDGDDVCGPHQQLTVDGACVCEEQAAPIAGEAGCVPCSATEVPGAEGCVCAPGYARPASGEACTALPAGLGADCDPGAACSDATFSHCQSAVDSGGYCTSTDCTTSDDCPAEYACDTAAEPSYCKRPPVGQEQPCATHDDCAGYEATYCESFQVHQCLVQDCTLVPDSCHEGWECCDLSTLGLDERLCVRVDQCPT